MANTTELLKFLTDKGPVDSGLTRDGAPTFGSHTIKGAGGGPLLPVSKFILPVKVKARIPSYVRYVDRREGWLMVASCGTGGQYRIPIIYTDAMLAKVKSVMGNPTTTDAEYVVLSKAAMEMENFLAIHMRAMSYDIEAYKVVNAAHDPWTQDCVDQSQNAICYGMILEGAGLMKFHTVAYPGYKGGITPHFYGRLVRKDNDKIVPWDLYHRSAGIGYPVKKKKWWLW